MSEKEKFKLFVKEKINIFHSLKDQLRIIIVANKGQGQNDYVINRTMDALIRLCVKYNIHYRFFLDEREFMRYALDEIKEDKPTLIYNRSISGPLKSRRAIIPTFCNFVNLHYLGNDGYQMGLLCNKFHYYSLLKSLNVSVADFWCYHHKHGWLNTPPPKGLKIIAKLSNENNAQSITQNSIFLYDDDKVESIKALSKEYDQPVVLQKFIIGYEVTVPVLIDNDDIYIPNVIGGKYGNDILFGQRVISESLLKERIHEDYREIYYDFSEINPLITNNIIEDSKLIVKALGIRGFSRFDLRVNESFDYYFNDLGSIPGMLPDSSYTFIYEKSGYTYEDFLITTICLDIPQNPILTNIAYSTGIKPY